MLAAEALRKEVNLSQKVAVSSIWTERVLDKDDDIVPLAQHIAQEGLQVPILTTSDLRLIDGLRRLEAVRSLGWEYVEVTATALYTVASHNINLARVEGTLAQGLTPQRIWDLYKDLQLMVPHTRALAQRGHRGGRYDRGLRPALREALGFTSDSLLQAVTQVYRMAEEDPGPRGDVARASVEKVNAGQLTAYMAAEAVRPGPKGFREAKVSAAQQRQSMDALVASLIGLSHSLDQFGALSPKFTKEEIEGWLAPMRQFRRRYAGFIHQVEKETTNR